MYRLSTMRADVNIFLQEIIEVLVFILPYHRQKVKMFLKSMRIQFRNGACVRFR